MDFVMHPIGVIHTSFTEKAETPIQSSHSQAIGEAEVYQEYVEGLKDLDGFSHIILLYIWHKSSGYDLLVKPFLDDRLHGIFATRYPRRPNPIGISIVHLLSVNGNRISFEGADMLDGTPLLDIKPYVPDFDQRDLTRTGWYETQSGLERPYPPADF